jgi:flagellar hook-length control protein FliK
VIYVVIPNIPLPVAGGPPTVANGQTPVATNGKAAGESGGGLFAALLAALEGVVAAPIAQTVGGGDANPDADAVLTEDADTEGEVVTLPFAVVTQDAATGEASPAMPVKETSVSVPVQRAVNVTAQPVATQPTAAEAPLPQPQGNAPPDVVPAPAKPATTTPEEPAAAATPQGNGPAATPETSASETATSVKPAQTTAVDPAAKSANRPAELAVLNDGESKKTESLSFEPAKPMLKTDSTREETVTTPIRKALEAFARAETRPVEPAAASRLQPQTVAPVIPADANNAAAIDVTRAAPVIGPAEVGGDAPKSVAGQPVAPEHPARTTLADAAETALRNIRYAARNGEQRITIRLVPESLGEMHIEVHSTKDSLTVRLVTENAMVREVMESSAHQLREALKQEGIDVRNITVTDDGGSARQSFYQRDANASRHGERGHAQNGQQSGQGASSNPDRDRATPRARHEGAFDQVA